MTIRRRGLAAAGLLLAGVRPAAAQWRWQAASGWPPDNPHARLLQRFREDVRQRSEGGMEIRLADGAARRGSQIRDAVQAGQVEIGDFTLAAIAQGDPLLELDTLPMLARDPEQAWRLAVVSRAVVEQRLKRAGLTMLYWVPWGAKGLFTGFTVDSIVRLRGTRMQGMTPADARIATLAGATLAPMDTEDAPQASASRQASVLLTSAATGVSLEAWRFARYFTPVLSSFAKNVACVQTRALETLPLPLRTLLQEAAARTEQAGWQALEAEGRAAQQVLIDHGMTVQQPSPKLLTELERIGVIILGEWTERAGPPGQRLLDAYREG